MDDKKKLLDLIAALEQALVAFAAELKEIKRAFTKGESQ
jgi:regulator of replication initiation timing